MKEIGEHRVDKPEIHAVRPVKKDLRLLKRMQPKPGQRMFELNLLTGIINQAEIEEVQVEIVPDKNLITGRNIGIAYQVEKRVIRKDNCLYWPAVNPKNADKHFQKLLGRAYKHKK